MTLRLLALTLSITLLSGCGGAGAPGRTDAQAKVLNVYNYSDYIAEDTIPAFEKSTGIKVTYDVFDSDEMVETKLLAGGSDYDVVVPTLNFFGRQIQAGVFLPLDKSKIPNLVNLDPDVMRRIAAQDPNNAYGVPYMIGTTGIGYNVDKLKGIFGNTDVANSWDLVFKPENLSKLKDCGVTILDTPSDMIPIALNYLGLDPHSTTPAEIEKAAALIKTIRPYVQNFHSSQYVTSLANGNTCLAVGWSGDIIQARDRAVEAGNNIKVAYAIPKEGAPQWFDMLAIPKDAKHPDNAYAFINYLLKPDVAAANTNFIHYANPVRTATPLVDAAIRNDTTIYPPPEVTAKMFTYAINPPEVDRLYTRLWTEIKTGH
ncbi:polyamine ABC transporter substrate-binding protein [Xanthomonas campestris pv. trichodesmae]|uniref:Putrescine-binding periplasmic protein n=2 Tax=Xanthomonas citri TaxID=346 RepID=A0AB33CNY8_XANCI|nr:polyamine ABC transporter substrate-binding protein [Xanthomonas citri]ASK91963.1 spermidine/putrescine ABC transporter substrate-binding protein PotF [Xanthomonas citri pv. vignicola]MBV6782740.1 polyamine ABC transporter substrate-binding protein [Xanthomonas campestris pv. trichodesmae]MBZ3922024.1 spermidine/putrescine ABC transporter substrate-binding protein [Xanthomonas campestris pv. trichodesmae]MBZ3926803.1 spermidine/putrescine ABC transporter substrate-binding protein [Xanthomona